jgi:preprotein translocase subunit SecG
MVILLTIVHIIVCFFLVVVVLLQSGKAADLAGAFGGMGSQTAFGPRGSATVLSKATTVAAVLFMVTSLTLAILATRGGGGARTVLEGRKPQPASGAPARPSTTVNVPAPGEKIPFQVDMQQLPPSGAPPAGSKPAAPAKPQPAPPAKK